MEYSWIIYLLFIKCIIRTATAKLTEITAEENSAINFYLPIPQECGTYNFTDPNESLVLTVFADGTTNVSGIYSYRGTATPLQNGTVIFTLHHISWRDKGTYATQTLVPSCQWYYTLKLPSDGLGPAYWEAWQSWSKCDATCGSGIRIRVRQCSMLDRCNGLSKNVEECSAEFACQFWGSWSSWSPCSATCGTGQYTRSRKCQNGGDCIGESSQVATCTLESCASWDNWSEWSSCSTSCGPGHKYRQRQCWIGTEQAHYNHCPGGPTETTSCTVAACRDIQYFWGSWYAWSPCSHSCGTGRQKRIRHCLLWASQQVSGDEYCTGNSGEEQGCQEQPCLVGAVFTTVTVSSGTTYNSEAPSDTVVHTSKPDEPLPYTTVVGGAAAGFIIILLLVIIVLLVRLKRKKDTSTRQRAIHDLANRQSKQVNIRAKSTIGRSETESQMYAEIESEFMDSEFDATSCNDYGPLPSSASSHGAVPGTNRTSRDQTTGGGNVFVFDSSAVNYQGQLRVPKISTTTMRSGNKDGDGYEKPITCLDRQRGMTYANAAYGNVVK